MIDLENRGCAYYTLSEIFKQQKFEDYEIVLGNANKTFAIESNKTDMYNWLTSVGVRMPVSKEWHSTKDILANTQFPFVVKQDTNITLGLQTVIVKSKNDFKDVLKSLIFTKCGSGIVQEFITGTEVTVTLLIGESNYTVVGSARDYKKQFADDQGLNTSGMGSVNVPMPNVRDQCDIIVAAFKQKYNYRGFLSCQFIIDNNNVPWLMECNTRLCSPEFQSMAINLPWNFSECVYIALTDGTVPTMTLGTSNAVTIGLLHADWPNPQKFRNTLDFSDSGFTVSLNLGKWDYNCYYGTLTNSGPRAHKELVDELYQYLRSKDVTPYVYRKDIAI